MGLTKVELDELLKYNKDDGSFTWVKNVGSRAKAGSFAGSKHSSGRVYICIKKRDYLAHRLVWLHFNGSLPCCDIDHINGDSFDNRIENLRLATHAENMQNHRRARADSASQLIGVMPRNRQKKCWYAEIRTNGKKKYLGSFHTKEEAHLAYLTAKRELHSFCTI